MNGAPSELKPGETLLGKNGVLTPFLKEFLETQTSEVLQTAMSDGLFEEGKLKDASLNGRLKPKYQETKMKEKVLKAGLLNMSFKP